jgi:Lon protease-like protein
MKWKTSGERSVYGTIKEHSNFAKIKSGNGKKNVQGTERYRIGNEDRTGDDVKYSQR